VNAYRWLAIASLLGLGPGCASAPIHYYTLTQPADRTASATDAAWVVEVRVTHIPQQLNHSELLVRTAPSEVTLLDNERWASPVKDEIRESLRLELQRRLLAQSAGSSAVHTKLLLELDVQQLEAQFGQRAWLEASWRATLIAADPKSTDTRGPTCTFRTQQDIQSGYPGIVEGYQRDIAALAEAIVASLGDLTRVTEWACQPASPPRS
jgi:uncharacterized lipoprotein YmbA